MSTNTAHYIAQTRQPIGTPRGDQLMSANTDQRPLTADQAERLWDMFCTYGQLRDEAKAQRYLHRDGDAADRISRQADALQEEYGRLIWSLVRDEDIRVRVTEAPDRS